MEISDISKTVVGAYRDKQKVKLAEELSELAAVMCKDYVEDRKSKGKFVEEAAQVLFLIEQLTWMYYVESEIDSRLQYEKNRMKIILEKEGML